MKNLDTPTELEKAQIEILRKMPPEKRLKMSIELTENTIKLLKEGVRNRHPEYSDEEVKFAVIKILLGEELFKKVYPQFKEIKP
ncbi:hypothetical protein [Pseudothermotoga thermarum]|uniref:Uncharacterized protein n=1 Tax=Pseudothermotoga thermarum DSM 5069 TaxID=688269 RepID=F7YVR4_9THEM|nr:hypothetical protein [Pseudothermotoga thermarum]AEH51731.1 hypothetical protein Theth_1684 [Pseudothermotoga thermarum DSM 5069]